MAIVWMTAKSMLTAMENIYRSNRKHSNVLQRKEYVQKQSAAQITVISFAANDTTNSGAHRQPPTITAEAESRQLSASLCD